MNKIPVFVTIFICLFLNVALSVAQSEELPDIILQTGHDKEIFSLVFSPDGQQLASSSKDGTVRLWDLTTGKSIRFFEGNTAHVSTLVFSPNGNQLVFGDDGGTIGIWDLESDQPVKLLEGHTGKVSTLVFRPDGLELASGSSDGTIRIWAAATGQPVRMLKGQNETFTSVAFSPDGRRIASGNLSGTIRLWDSFTGHPVRSLEGPTSLEGDTVEVSTLVFSPNGNQLVFGGDDGTIGIWNLGTDKMVPYYSDHSDRVLALAFNPDGQHVVSGSEDGTVDRWDPATRQTLDNFVGQQGKTYALGFSPDVQQFASGSFNGTIILWNLKEAKIVRTLEKHLDDGTIIPWNLKKPKIVHTLKNYLDIVNSVAFSPDGRQLASGTQTGIIFLWDTKTGKPRILRAPSGSVTSVVFSPDGKQLASGYRDRTLRIWDPKTEQVMRTMKSRGGSIYSLVLSKSRKRGISSLAFSPDGRQLGSGTFDGTIELWDTVTGRAIYSEVFTAPTVTSVAFSPDGREFASGDVNGSIWLLDLTTREAHRINTDLGWIKSLVFRPDDGRKLVIASADGTITLLERTKSRVTVRFQLRSVSTTSVAFSPDGRQLASGHSDGAVRLWDPETGEPVRTMKGHNGDVNSVAFSPDGRMLASGSVDGSTKIWDATNGRPLVSLYGLGSRDFATHTSKEGYFVASEKGANFISWKFKNQLFSFARYAEPLNIPEYVADALLGLDVPAPDFSWLKDKPPKLTWVNPIEETDSGKIQIILNYEGFNPYDHGVFTHNNQHVKPLEAPSGARMNQEIQLPLELQIQQNEIFAVAIDSKDLQSDPIAKDFFYTKGKKLGGPIFKKSGGKFRGLVAGVIHYVGGLESEPPLKLGEAARRMASSIRRLAEGRGFEPDKIEITVLAGGKDTLDEPTRTRFLETILRFGNDSHEKDTLAVYFTGHGAKDYLYGSGADLDNDIRRIPFSKLSQLISESRAGTNLVFLDTCRVLNASTTDGGEPLSGFAKSADGDAWFYSANAKKGQRSYIDKKLGYGIYTKYLSAALEGHEADGWSDQGLTNKKDGVVTATELNAFITRKVRDDVTKNVSGTSKQDPQISVPGEFPLYEYNGS